MALITIIINNQSHLPGWLYEIKLANLKYGDYINLYHITFAVVSI